MKINEIIRQKRLALNLTQEQVASVLGVSTPAVNKWEKGLSYPDITLLPQLARILNTDLNTLLSFKDDLSKNEVALIMNQVSAMFEKEGFVAGYELAISKIKEYPNCDLLLLNMASLIEGGLALYNKNEHVEKYEGIIESLYEKVANTSSDFSLKQQAQVYLVKRMINKEEFQKAKAILDSMPDDCFFEKRMVEIKLLISSGDLERAVKLAEEGLLMKVYEVHEYLMSLMNIAIKQGREEDAKYIADVDCKAAQLFDLWTYHQYVAHYELYDALGMEAKKVKLFASLLSSLNKKWEINASPLYRHMKVKDSTFDFKKVLKKDTL